MRAVERGGCAPRDVSAFVFSVADGADANAFAFALIPVRIGQWYLAAFRVRRHFKRFPLGLSSSMPTSTDRIFLFSFLLHRDRAAVDGIFAVESTSSKGARYSKTGATHHLDFVPVGRKLVGP
jgi:hypothetical protein